MIAAIDSNILGLAFLRGMVASIVRGRLGASPPERGSNHAPGVASRGRQTSLRIIRSTEKNPPPCIAKKNVIAAHSTDFSAPA